MHDIRWIRDNPDAFDRGLARRGLDAMSGHVLELDTRRRAVQTRLQEMQARRNAASKEIGQAKAKGGDVGALMDEVARIKDDMPKAEAEDKALGAELDELLAGIPNLPAADVPDGADEEANVEVRRVGEPPRFNFEPKEHDAIGEALGMMDFERAAKLSGARFVVLSAGLARLERALASFMLDLQTAEFGYREVEPASAGGYQTAFGTGQLPKFGDDLYQAMSGGSNYDSAEIRKYAKYLLSDLKELEKKYPNSRARENIKFYNSLYPYPIDDIEKIELLNVGAIYDVIMEYYEPKSLYLIPTAEVPLTNLVAGEILDEDALPLRFTALTPCFRSEAGAAGKDTRGMIRQHQFYKVELVSIVHPDQSDEEHERKTKAAETVLQRLELPYRVVAVHRRHGILGAQDLRHRGVAARPGALSRDIVLLELRRLPGASHERALPLQGREGHALRPHAERLGPRGRAHADRGAGELPAGGRLGRRARGAASLYGRPGAHRPPHDPRGKPDPTDHGAAQPRHQRHRGPLGDRAHPARGVRAAVLPRPGLREHGAAHRRWARRSASPRWSPS